MKKMCLSLPFLRLTGFFRRFPLLPDILAVLGILLYAARAFYLSHHLTLNIDEGVYLTKGWLFARGDYVPYQDYGPWTQKMPVSYYLFGLAELIFGPSLRTGRYFAVGCAILLVIGLWLLIRRTNGRWFALLPILYMLLNRVGILFYVSVSSQVIVACESVWALTFALGGNRKPWQVVFGAVLAGLTAITRQNLLPFTLLFLAYVFWEYGRRVGWISLLVAAIVFFLPHILFWPNILSLWTLLPQSLTPFLDQWRMASGTTPLWGDFPFLTQVHGYWEGVYYFFVPFFGTVCSLFLIRPRKEWKKPEDYRAYVFLAIGWFTLLLIHFYACLFLNYSSFTFSSYVAFFQFLGLVIIAISYQSWQMRIRFWRGAVLFPILLASATLTGYLRAQELRFLFEIPMPRIHGFQIQPGTMTVVSIVSNKFRLPVDTVVPVLTTLGAFAFIILLVLGSCLLLRRSKKASPVASASVVLLVLGFAVTPAAFLGQGHPEAICSLDPLQADEEVGAAVAEAIPPGATVYWYPSIAPIPLLHVRDPHLFPQQLDNSFTYVFGGEDDQLARLGFWNDSLAAEWLSESSYVMIVSEMDNNRITEFLEGPGKDYAVEEISLPAIPLSCQDRNTWILHLFKISR